MRDTTRLVVVACDERSRSRWRVVAWGMQVVGGRRGARWIGVGSWPAPAKLQPLTLIFTTHTSPPIYRQRVLCQDTDVAIHRYYSNVSMSFQLCLGSSTPISLSIALFKFTSTPKSILPSHSTFLSSLQSNSSSESSLDSSLDSSSSSNTPSKVLRFHLDSISSGSSSPLTSKPTSLKS